MLVMFNVLLISVVFKQSSDNQSAKSKGHALRAESSQVNSSLKHQIHNNGLHFFNIPLQILQTWERLDFGSCSFPL